MLENRGKGLLLLQLHQFTTFFFSHQRQMCHDFMYFEQIFMKKYKKSHVLGIDSDPDRPDPDRHALDADPDTDPAK